MADRLQNRNSSADVALLPEKPVSASHAANAEQVHEGFRSRFELVPALSEALKDEAYALRHKVYCEELKWEPIHPSGRETDEYDAHSVHFLLRSLTTGENVGCVRLVVPPPGEASFRLPFLRVCEDKLDPSARAFLSRPRERIAEVSRLTVSRSFRRRQGEAAQAVPDSTDNFVVGPKPRFPYILVGLYVAVVAMAKLRGIHTLFVLTEPRLAEHFRKVGVTEIQRIGAVVNHRGPRVPSLLPVDSIIGGFCMNPVIRPIYESVYTQLKGS